MTTGPLAFRSGLLLVLAWWIGLCGFFQASAASLDGPPMRFAVVRNIGTECYPVCAEWISAQGTITTKTGSQFKQFLRREVGNRKLPVVLESRGGDVDSSLAMGRLIRARGLDVGVGHTNFIGCSPGAKGCKPRKDGTFIGSAISVNAHCASACAFVLAGGVSRVVGRLSYLGVHQITTIRQMQKLLYRVETRWVNGKKVTKKRIIKRIPTGTQTSTRMSKQLRRKLGKYLAEMGVSTDLLESIEKTPASTMLQLKQDEMVALKLVTGTGRVEYWFSDEQCSQPKPWPPFCRKESQPSRVDIVRYPDTRCMPLCPEWIALQGDIDRNTLPLLREALQKRDGSLPVVISSRGGNLDLAMALGRFVREQGLTVAVGKTVLHNQCRYAGEPCGDGTANAFRVGYIEKVSKRPVCSDVCVLVLAGGAARIIREADSIDLDSSASMAGVSASGNSKAAARAEAKVMAYLDEMGASPELMESFPATGESSLRLDGRALWARKFANARSYTLLR